MPENLFIRDHIACVCRGDVRERKATWESSLAAGAVPTLVLDNLRPQFIHEEEKKKKMFPSAKEDRQGPGRPSLRVTIHKQTLLCNSADVQENQEFQT